jgi:hypothetical protein
MFGTVLLAEGDRPVGLHTLPRGPEHDGDRVLVIVVTDETPDILGLT